jgi:Leucine-rich repeat (LRR) protein
LSDNKIKEYKFLKENPSNLCFLRDLNLSNNQLRELSDFPQQRLTNVNLANNKIEKCDEFNGALCKSVKTLDLSKNRLTDLKGLSSMPGLVKLDLSQNKIISLKGLCDFPCLETLSLVNN